MEENKTIESLMKLGLTSSQAKIYLTMAISGPRTGRATANSTHIATNDVYRILNELHQKGLVEKIISKPTLYRATQINDGLTILLQGKKEEYMEAEIQVKTLSDTLEIRLQKERIEVEPQFTVISEMKILSKIHERLSEASKQSIDFVIPIKKTKFQSYLPEYIDRAIKRKVKIRAIMIDDRSGEDSKVTKNSSYEIRAVKDIKPVFGLHIFDKQEVTLAISEKPIPILSTNNMQFVRITQVYFEDLWKNAR